MKMLKQILRIVLIYTMALAIGLGVIPAFGQSVDSVPLAVENYDNLGTYSENFAFYGDVNLDQTINAVDALMILKYAVGKGQLNEVQKILANVNKDKKIDALDALAVLKFSVGQITEFDTGNIYMIKPIVPVDPDDPDDPPAPGNLKVYVTDAPYNATGDGKTSDRIAIQKAIDDVNAAGGGQVILTADKTFLTGNLILKSNVDLHFEDGAVIQQTEDYGDYVDPVGWESPLGSPWTPRKGTIVEEWDVRWNHTWAYNYALMYAGEGCKNVKITGDGIIKMTPYREENTLFMMPMNFWMVDGIELSGVTIDGFNAWGVDFHTCSNILVENFTMKNFRGGCTDGVHFKNCQNVLVTNCYINAGDDAISIISNYGDPRQTRWCKNNVMAPSKNIEICNSTFIAPTPCKGIALFAISMDAPDMSQMEMSDIYIHDNDISELGLWTYQSMWGTQGLHSGVTPMKNWRFENNNIGTVQSNMSAFAVSGLQTDDARIVSSYYAPKNGDFEDKAITYWIPVIENDATAGIHEEDGNYCGKIGNLDKGDAKLYQGITKKANILSTTVTARVKTDGTTCRFFARDSADDEDLVVKEFSNTQWETITVDIPMDEATGDQVLIGIERGNAASGCAYIDDITLTNIMAPDSHIYRTRELNKLHDALSAPANTGDRYTILYPDTPSPAEHQLAFYLTVDEITNPNSKMTIELCWWENQTRLKYFTIPYSAFPSPGKYIVVLENTLWDEYNSSADSATASIAAETGIKFTWDKCTVAGKDYEFTDNTYKLVGKFTEAGSDPDPKDETVYRIREFTDLQVNALEASADSVNDYTLFQKMNGVPEQFKMGFYLDVAQVTDATGKMIIELTRYDDATKPKLYITVPYSAFPTTGKYLIVLDGILWEGFGAQNAEEQATGKIYADKGISFAWEKCTVTGKDYDFTNDTYSLAGEFTATDKLEVPEPDPDPDPKDETVYRIREFTDLQVNALEASADSVNDYTLFQKMNGVPEQFKMGFYLDVVQVTDATGKMIIELTRYDDATKPKLYITVPYSAFPTTGKYLIVLDGILWEGFGAQNAEEQATGKIYADKGISFAWEKCTVTGKDYDFTNDTYSLAGEFTATDELEVPEPEPDPKDETVYRIREFTDLQVNTLEASADSVNDYTVLYPDTPTPQQYKLACYLTVTEINNSDSSMTIKLTWWENQTNVTTVTVPYSAFTTTGKYIVVIEGSLWEGFVNTTHSATARITAQQGANFTWDKCVVTGKDYTFNDEYTVVKF